MCRLAAYKGPELLLRDLFHEGPHSLYQQAWNSQEMQGTTLNADGFGFGWHLPDGEAATFCAGTRWIGELQKTDHPAHELFNEVKDKVAGVSCGCADVFGGRDEAEKSGYELITDNHVPNTSGLPSLHDLVSQGYTLLTF